MMSAARRIRYSPRIVALLAGTIAAFVPLVGHLHFESAFLASLIGTFLAVFVGRRTPKRGETDLTRLGVVLFWVYLAGVPLLAVDLWSGCFSVVGLGFWIFLPSFSILLGFSLVRLFREWKFSYPGSTATFLLLLLAVGEFLFEFYTFPQVYFFNHVWGYWPGPIYDTALSIDGRLLFFRGLTALWVLLLWFVPEYPFSASAKWITGLAAAGLLLGYVNLTEMGVIRPESAIRHQLRGETKTPHFRIHYDKQKLSDTTVGYYRARHSYFRDRIADTLQLKRNETQPPILSFIYAHPWQKHRMVGAKFTSYVPVWLARDQLHIAYPQLSSSLHHELVHVAAKSFGNPLLNASWSIGMVEGLAVALAGTNSPYSTVDQLVAAQTPYPSAAQMKNALSFFGFYGGRKYVGYLTTGSFVAYLLQNYPIKHFKQSYRSSDLAGNYPVPFDSLIAGWHQHLRQVSTDSIDLQRRAALFQIPSLLERACPHVQSEASRRWDHYRYLKAEGDTTRAYKLVNRTCQPQCPNLRIWSEWARLQLKRGAPQKVKPNTVDTARFRPGHPLFTLRLADARWMQGDTMQARKWLRKTRFRKDTLGRLQEERSLRLRKKESSWTQTIHILYERTQVSPADFARLPGSLKGVVIDRWIERRQWHRLKRVGGRIQPSDIDLLNFKTFVRLVRRWAYLGMDSAANSLISVLEHAADRPRHRQMVKELQQWRGFLQVFRKNGYK